MAAVQAYYIGKAPQGFAGPENRGVFRYTKLFKLNKDLFFMQEDIIKKIKEDILNSGFPLELEVSSKLEKKGWHIFQNEYVSEYNPDRNIDQEYEIDILALKLFEKEISGFKFQFWPRIIIECKKSKKHPWVFFTREKQLFDESHKLIKQSANFGVNKSFRLPPNEYVYDVDFLGKKIDYASLNMFSWKRKATSYCQSFRDPNKENEIYKAIQSLLRNLKIIKSKQDASFAKGSWCFMILDIFIPVIVLDGQLFEGYLDKGNLEIKETDYVPLVFKSSIFNLDRVCCHILKKNEVDAFIDKIQEDCEKLLEEYSKLEYTQVK